eukprot:4102624-Prorocentrum_lima.AAC.1
MATYSCFRELDILHLSRDHCRHPNLQRIPKTKIVQVAHAGRGRLAGVRCFNGRPRAKGGQEGVEGERVARPVQS